MPPELADVREWLRKADHDRQAAELMSAAIPALTDTAAFHCQQAVEKLLKAYLVWREHEFEKIHDLEELASLCAQSDGEFQVLIFRIVPLTAYAVRYRYPGPNDPTVEEVGEALGIVHEVRAFVLDRLPPETRPNSMTNDASSSP